MAKPVRTMIIVASTAMLAAAGGFLAARYVISPADQAAQTAPPAERPVTVPVAKKALTAQVVTRGDIAFIGAVPVKPPPGEGTQVITGKVPEVGSSVTEGMLLTEVSGRPLLVLGGTIPLYRNLVAGSTGPDVESVQKALSRLGFYQGPADGVYSAAVAEGVGKLYAERGYPAPQPSSEILSEVKSAQEAEKSTAAAVLEARRSRQLAAKPIPESQRIAAQNAVDEAAREVENAQNAPGPPNQQALDAANRAMAHASTVAQDAQARRDAAVTTRDQAIESGNPELIAAATRELEARDQELAHAQQGLAEAQHAVDAASQPGPPDQAAIDRAQGALQVAIATRNEALTGPDMAAANEAITAAEQAHARAADALGQAQAKAITPVSLSEIVVIAALPRRVSEVAVKTGSTVTDALLTVTGADLQITASVASDEIGLLSKDMPATLRAGNGKIIEAKIAEVKPPAKAGEAPSISIDPTGLTDEDAQQLAGTNVRVTIKVGATSGEVLVVPEAALYSDASGNPRVEVYQSDGSTRLQSVQTGLTAAGDVEVKPVSETGADLAPGKDTLDAGTLVIVGQSLAKPPAAAATSTGG